jgi:uncharacterized membrane protein YagU involved in acid resistance
MATASDSSAATTTRIPVGLAAGVAGGLSGGIIFGMLMQMMGMLPMVAMLVGSKSTTVGWGVHLAISAFIGVTYAILFARWATRPATSLLLGMGYGVLWWVLGPLLIMPARLGMELFMFNAMTGQSLMGHLIYGAVLGLVYGLIRTRLHHG